MKYSQKNSLKTASFLLALCMLFCASGMVAYAQNAPVTTTQITAQGDVADKDETVYVLAGADGSVQKVIVSGWLKNTQKLDYVSDFTNVKDLANIKDDRSYTLDKNGAQVWNAKGEDVYYQGTSDSTLPVDLFVSYKLDGKKISAEELAGKSGKVEMKFTYQNNLSKVVSVNGQNQTMYVPFVMVTGMILEDNFSNVSVSGGKVVNDGSRNVVMGFAVPGLNANLGFYGKLPEEVVVCADVKNFSLSTTMTLATNSMFNKIETADLNSLQDMTNSMNTLNEAGLQLIDGCSTLYSGLQTLLQKSDRLVAGAKDLNAGGTKLYDGAKQVSDGFTPLRQGLGELASNNTKLNEGALSVYNTFLSTADAQLAANGLTLPRLTITNYKSVLQGVLDQLNESEVRAQATKKVEAIVTETVTSGVKANILSGVLTAKSLSQTEYDALSQGSDVKVQIDAAVEQTLKSSDTQNMIAGSVQTQMATGSVKQQIEDVVNTAKQKAQSIQGLIVQLDTYGEFYTGIGSYTQGVQDTLDGVNTLSQGAQTLTAGLNDLVGGTNTLLAGSDQLVGGVKQLNDGGMQLSDGLTAFYNDGIKKLCELGTGADELVARLKATVNLSKEYQSFGGSAMGQNNTVKFIYKTQSIGQ